jgi:hypothetical protein
LDSESGRFLVSDHLLRDIERESPVIYVLVIRLLAEVVGFSTEDTPVNVIQVLQRGLRNMVLHAIRKVSDKVMDGPV